MHVFLDIILALFFYKIDTFSQPSYYGGYVLEIYELF